MDRGAQILRTLIELWCDQYDQEIISLEITKNEKSDERAGGSVVVVNA